MKNLLKVTLIFLFLQICLAVFTGLSVSEIPLLPGSGEYSGVWLSGWVGAFVYPGITAFLLFYGYADAALSRKHNPTRFDRFFPPLIYVPALFIALLQLYATLGGMKIVSPHIDHFILIAGIFFVLLGNIMPRVPYKSISGLPLPWLFKSEKIWRKTHRVTGYTWVAAGAICLLTALLCMGLKEPETGHLLLRVSSWIMASLLLFPVPYSYFIHKKRTI